MIIVDHDNRVTNSDLGILFAGFDSGPNGIANSTSSSGGSLVYDRRTGNVRLDPREADGQVITSFLLADADAAGLYRSDGVSLPFEGPLATVAPSEISATDASATGFSEIHVLGDILPAGLDVAELDAALAGSSYVGALGTGRHAFKLLVVPEPALHRLAAIAVLALGGLNRRSWAAPTV